MTSPPTRIDGIKLNASFVEGVAEEAIVKVCNSDFSFLSFVLLCFVRRAVRPVSTGSETTA